MTKNELTAQIRNAISEMQHPRFFVTGPETKAQFEQRMARAAAVRALEAALEFLEPSADPFARAALD